MIARLCLFVLFAVGMPALAHAFDANGNEDRCAELGAACKCSEPMNGTIAKLQDFFFGFNDTTSGGKQCRSILVAGAVYETDQANGNLTSVTSATDATMFAAIPSGHSITRIAKSPVDGNSTGALGTRLDGYEEGRVCIRVYRYKSPDFLFGDAFCHNCSKTFQTGFTAAWSGGPIFQMGGGNTDYGVYDMTPAFGWSGTAPNGGGWTNGDGLPGQSGTLVSDVTLRGKWVMHEACINNWTGSGTSSVEWYYRNVTDDGPEITLIDTDGAAGMDGIHINTNVNYIGTNNFIDEGGGSGCVGFYAHSNLLIAAWSTNTGQRIGPSVEFEGGAAPSGGTLALFLRGLALLHIGATGFLMWERRMHARVLYEISKELVAMWRWKRTVNWWLAMAPLRLSPPVPSMTVPTMQPQASVSRHDGVTP